MQTFNWPTATVQLYVPDAAAVYKQWQDQPPGTDRLYWARIWPASLALCDFIYRHRLYFKDKKVVEIAAGLALPSLLCAHWARSVECSDRAAEAAQFVNQSITQNKFRNITCSTLNWNQLNLKNAGDILLLSDVNYDESVFAELWQLLKDCINQGTVVILSTPQRLMAKPFIEKFADHTALQEEVVTAYNGENVYSSVFVLNRTQQIELPVE